MIVEVPADLPVIDMVETTPVWDHEAEYQMPPVSPPAKNSVTVLKSVLRSRWCRGTSADPQHWTPANPSYGQCAVTSLIVQDLFGGSLVRAKVSGTTHYWNRLPSGEEIDLTREQFGGVVDILLGEERARDYVLSFPDTARRYRELAESVRKAVANE